MDSCSSASGTRSFDDSSDSVRFAPVPSDVKLQDILDPAIWSPTLRNGLRSHILLSASSSSEQAWESKGRGVFTVALLDLFEECQIEHLRYCDIPMRIDIQDSKYANSLSVKSLTY